MKAQITEVLRSTGRDNIENLITFLDGSDFYTAPASTRHHLAYPGGLAEHTLNVLNCAIAKNLLYNKPCPQESVIIAAIAHDFCKIGMYREVHEEPTTPQLNYLKSLMSKAKLVLPSKLNKTYAGVLIDFMLNHYKGDGSIPLYVPNYKIEDKFPLGHGEKSLYLASLCIKLFPNEALAIRWHMGAFDLNFQSPYQKYPYQQAVDTEKLVTIIQIADIEAVNLVEV